MTATLTFDAFCLRCDRPIRGHDCVPQLCFNCNKAAQAVTPDFPLPRRARRGSKSDPHLSQIGTTS